VRASTLHALVVEDEPHARSELVYALETAGDVEIAEAETAVAALAALQGGKYDVVFLDVRMPGLSGIDAMPVINNLVRRPEVVFVTAYGDHAVDAFEHDAIDYLLKPVSQERLRKTLARVRARRAAAQSAAGAPLPPRLPVERGGKTLLVRPSEIRFASAHGHDVNVHLYDGDYRFRGTLAACASLLEQRGFLRVHRAYLVNPEHVIEVRPFFAGTYVLLTDDKARSEVPVSRAYAKTVRTAFGL
jgi:two-component system, LytTR family, response regulator LytT